MLRRLGNLITQPKGASVISKKELYSPDTRHVSYMVPRFPHVHYSQDEFSSKSLQSEKK